MRFFQVDVFTGAPYGGNPLAVFPEAESLTRKQMQAIAREMNLSETTFVTRASTDEYDVRIFTPLDELPFAGHPTIGTAWVLRHLNVVTDDEVAQRSAAGETVVTARGDRLWFAREGSVSGDLEERTSSARSKIAHALGLHEDDVGLEARELGRHGRLRPATSNAGIEQLLVPMKDLDALARISVRSDELAALTSNGAYCFVPTQAGRVRARGFFSPIGIPEDPATGSAAAALGLYLADRLGAIDLEITQGVEMGRESKIDVHATPGRVEVGGRCVLVMEGALTDLP